MLTIGLVCNPSTVGLNRWLTAEAIMSRGQGGGPKPIWTEQVLNDLAEEMMDWYDDHESSISLEAFCASNPRRYIYPMRLSEWAKTNPKMAEAIRTVKGILAARTIERTSLNGMPPALGIFLLKNNGYTDRVATDINHSGSVAVGSLAQALANDA